MKSLTLIILASIITFSGCEAKRRPVLLGEMAGPFDFAQDRQSKIYSPKELKLDPNERYILTPKESPKPQINSAKVFGVRPGSPLLYTIAATGNRPLAFDAQGLPDGLILDKQTGQISGKIDKFGTYTVTLKVTNSLGTTNRELKIVASDKIALTPPMGWNSWYIHYNRVSDAVMREAADQMINTRMADYGYQYVNIDDCWMKKQGDEPYRDANGDVLPNAKFPDMKGLADYIHSKGLKAGIYTSPGPWTCADYVGAYKHEATDARKFAEWGFDFLKYDWCSYVPEKVGSPLEQFKKPYQQMHDELQKLDRDIVFNLCQYGMGNVWTWGGEVGNCWRTTGDLGLERNARLPGFYKIGFSNARHWEFARPGAWNDPDYILLGWVGDANTNGIGKPTTLSPNEQYSYMSMWCLMAAPLIFSGDMAKLDAFTLNVLCNSEVIAVDQDPLGKQASIVKQTRNEYILLKDLEDGSKAVGLFNTGEEPNSVKVTWQQLGVTGNRTVRDLWRQKDISTYKDSFEAAVGPHGVVMVRIFPKNK